MHHRRLFHVSNTSLFWYKAMIFELLYALKIVLYQKIRTSTINYVYFFGVHERPDRMK